MQGKSCSLLKKTAFRKKTNNIKSKKDCINTMGITLKIFILEPICVCHILVMWLIRLTITNSSQNNGLQFFSFPKCNHNTKLNNETFFFNSWIINTCIESDDIFCRLMWQQSRCVRRRFKRCLLTMRRWIVIFTLLPLVDCHWLLLRNNDWLLSFPFIEAAWRTDGDWLGGMKHMGESAGSRQLSWAYGAANTVCSLLFSNTAHCYFLSQGLLLFRQMDQTEKQSAPTGYHLQRVYICHFHWWQILVKWFS